MGASLKYFLPKESTIKNFIKYETVNRSWRLENDGESPAIPLKCKRMGRTLSTEGVPSII
jgi:hypothetical protein